MNRRTLLSAVGASIAVGTSGCVSNGRVVNERQENVMIPTGRGETTRIEEVDGDGAITFTVTADRKFDVYYFTSPTQYEDYRRYISGQQVENPTVGDPQLTQVAVYNEAADQYEARAPADGGRVSITVEDTHYFVIDHSNYGMGVPVDAYADPLRAYVNLTVIDKQFPI